MRVTSHQSPYGAQPVAAPGCGDGSAVEIADGVLWLRMPIPMIVNVNVWAIADGDGWTVVDTGMRSDATVAAWQAAFASVLRGGAVRRVIATHFHPDHCGMARWLVDQSGASFHMTQLEYFHALLAHADGPGEAPNAWTTFFRRAGWSDDALDNYRAEFGLFRRISWRVPDNYERLIDGDDLTIGRATWRVIVGSGHSPEQALLYDAARKILIAGDQVLPKISSNVSVLPREPHANPLADWFASLEHIRATVPDDVLVLPSHGEPFFGLHSRIDAVLTEHRQRLDAIRVFVETPRLAVDAFPLLFRRPITHQSIRMATGETIAHLNYLRAQGEIDCVTGSDGLVRWHRDQTREGASTQSLSPLNNVETAPRRRNSRGKP